MKTKVDCGCEKDVFVCREHHKPQHTPTPWVTDSVDGKAIVRFNHEWVATLELGKNMQTCEANAAFIVKAVNLLPELRKHLQGKCEHQTEEECNATMLQMVYEAEGK